MRPQPTGTVASVPCESGRRRPAPACGLLKATVPSRYRECELKHGRVAMLACAGMITSDKFHPLFGGKNSGNPLEAIAQVRSVVQPRTLSCCEW